jgi:hypothetical protein
MERCCASESLFPFPPTRLQSECALTPEFRGHAWQLYFLLRTLHTPVGASAGVKIDWQDSPFASNVCLVCRLANDTADPTGTQRLAFLHVRPAL